MERVIDVRNLAKRFSSVKRGKGMAAWAKSLVRPEVTYVDAVKGIDLEIERGELLAFIGPNGAGKSTTIKLITGILFPDAGEISVLGMNPHKYRKKLCYRIGTVFGQKSQLWFHLPARDSFELLGAIYDIDSATVRRRVDELTDLLDLGDYLDQPVRKLSLGQRIRCEIAASLIHEPELLFLDEPSIGLDVVVKQKIRALIKRINDEKDVTIFLTSHDAGDIEKICRRAIVINEGTLVWDGSIKEMKYGLLNKRIVDLKLEAMINFAMPGVEVLKTKDFSAKLELDLKTTSVEKVVHRVMSETSILDMGVSAIPMEEIIGMIYAGELRGSSPDRAAPGGVP
jgi:ABC-2 type transport system ATP-binding protein